MIAPDWRPSHAGHHTNMNAQTDVHAAPASTTRRGFLKTTAALAGTAALGPLALERNAHAAGSDIIRVGLIGCGGRGTDAALNALNAGEDIRLVALADIFAERLFSSRDRLHQSRPDQVHVPEDRCFVGFDAYRQLLASGLDAVLIAPCSHFIPAILEAAVAAGKHVFCEKPHFNWLSGDQTAQQLIHSLDKASWALGDRPPRLVYGVGGRQTMLAPEYGDLFDHQAFVFEYEPGIRVFAFTRNQSECYPNTSDTFFGTKDRCDLLQYRIEGETNWRYDRPRQNMYDLTHGHGV